MVSSHPSYLSVVIYFTLLCSSSIFCFASDNLSGQDLVSKAKQALTEVQVRNRQLSQDISEKRSVLSNEILLKRRKLEEAKKVLNETRRKLTKSKKAYVVLSSKVQKMNMDQKRLNKAIQESKKELISYWDSSYMPYENSELSTKMHQELNEVGKQSIYEQIKLFFNYSLRLLEEGTSSGQFNAITINHHGEKVESEVLRIGSLQTYALQGPKGVMLEHLPGSEYLHALELSSESEEFIAQAIINDGKLIPLDVSGGLVRGQKSNNLWQQIEEGGLLVWPILILGFLAICIVLERFFTLRQLSCKYDDLLAKVLVSLDANNMEEAQDHCRQYPSAVSRLLLAGLTNRHQSKTQLENILDEAILHETPRLEKRLPYLTVIAASTPLLGLLGTVTGMISTFQMISLYGTGDPQVLSGGISEALITTQLGLAVAIPVLLLHNVLSSRVDKIYTDLEKIALTFINHTVGRLEAKE
ncbi:MAG: MotA/TolQ/ExbB proton channel family protein [Planctomycetes bacterium]|nr:MotA/TolQ/ExbB proton channel family protein [Planctomycetota bacterium]